MNLRSNLQSLWQHALALAFVAMVGWLVYAVGGTALRWCASWVDRVDYEAQPGEIAAVIEATAGCRPCDVYRIAIREHELTFVARGGDGAFTEYKLRDRFLRRARLQPHLKGDLRLFDPRAVDVEILRGLMQEARASASDAELTLEKRWRPEDPVCLSGGTVARAVDGVSPCAKPR